MNTFVKARIIGLLDEEFDNTVVALLNKKAEIDNSHSFSEIAEKAKEAAELEESLQTIFNIALQVLEG